MGVPEAIANPTSAIFNAGASFVPSPVMAMTSLLPCNLIGLLFSSKLVPMSENLPDGLDASNEEVFVFWTASRHDSQFLPRFFERRHFELSVVIDHPFSEFWPLQNGPIVERVAQNVTGLRNFSCRFGIVTCQHLDLDPRSLTLLYCNRCLAANRIRQTDDRNQRQISF